MHFLRALLILAATTSAHAQTTAPRPFEILDNSFLVEEAFNQEAGIFQNILLIQRSGSGTPSFEFTQEWPLGGPLHQLSYTVPIEDGRLTGLGLNYRLQLLSETASGPAFSPRLTVLLARGSDSENALQLNLPVSKQFGDFYVHANAGYIMTRGASPQPTAGGSLIYRVRPLINLMLESVVRAHEYDRQHSLILSPGIRAAINAGDKQLVLGAAVPFGLLQQDEARSLLAYLSYELPFRRQRP